MTEAEYVEMQARGQDVWQGIRNSVNLRFLVGSHRGAIISELDRCILAALHVRTHEVGTLGPFSKRRSAHIVAVYACVLLILFIGAAGESQQGSEEKERKGLKTHESIQSQKGEKIKSESVIS